MSVRGLAEQAWHRSLIQLPGGLEIKRLENATEAWIISDIKPHVRERDKSREAQPCAHLLTHNGTVAHKNPDCVISSVIAIVPHPDLPVTISLNTTLSLCNMSKRTATLLPNVVKTC